MFSSKLPISIGWSSRLAQVGCRLRYANCLACQNGVSSRQYHLPVTSSKPLLCTQQTHIYDPNGTFSHLGMVFQYTGQTRSMAGHSKWQNIRHIKGAKDHQKSLNATKLSNKIRVAIKEGGSTDPKLNFLLARAMEEGKRLDIPNATMLETIKKVGKSAESGSIVHIEGMGPGNCMLIIETFTDKIARSRQHVQSVLKQFGGKIGNSGFSGHAFEYKGVVHAEVSEGTEPDLDKATEAAIEAEAEDVEDIVSDSGERLLQFICDPKDVHKVKTNLGSMEYNVKDARLAYIPINMTPLSSDFIVIAEKMLDKLEDLDDVMRVYHNIEEAT